MVKTLFMGILFSLNLYASEPNKTDFTVICYHDFIKNHDGNSYSVYISNLIQQFEYLKANYNVIGFEDVILAKKGLIKLPPKAVVLTVDDGLKSFETIFFPLLKLYNFKATFAVVGKWSEEEAVSEYSKHNFKDPKIVNWDRLKKLSSSKLVQIASHSYNLHNSVMFNSQGNRAPSAGFLEYDFINKKYESKKAFKSRIRRDLHRMNQLIRKNIGRNPSIMVWPFGSFNGYSQKVAKDLGLNINFSIENGINKINKLDIIYRDMIMSETTLSDFSKILNGKYSIGTPIRSLKIELDQIWDNDQKIRRKNINKLLDSVKEINPNIVLITPVKASHSNSTTQPSPFLGQKGDFLRHISHTLKSRAGVDKTYVFLNFNKNLSTKRTLQIVENLALRADLNGFIFSNLPKGKADQELRFLITKKLKILRPFWTKNLFINSNQLSEVKVNEEKYKNIFINFDSSPLLIKDQLMSLNKLMKNDKRLSDRLIPHIQANSKFTQKNENEIKQSFHNFLEYGFKNYSIGTIISNLNNFSFLKSQLSVNDFPYKTRRAD